jgi:serine/threonine protein phosphatase 1
MTTLQKHLEVNEKGRDFVVGDLHGSFSLLTLALDHVRFDPARDRLISVGDLIDRGPDSMKCLELIQESWFHSVYANHEDMMVKGLEKQPSWFYVWLNNGGAWHTHEDQAQLRSLVFPAVKELPWIITVDLPDNKKFHVIHAELDQTHQLSDEELLFDFDDLALEPANDGEICIWGRLIFRSLYRKKLDEHAIAKWRRGAKLEKVAIWCQGDQLSNIYCGHSIMRKPTIVGKLINLDTGAYASYSNEDDAGLTITEPLTNRFWTTNLEGTQEVKPVTVL